MVGHRQRERFGPNIAEAVLESGDRLVATARKPKRLDDLVKTIRRSRSRGPSLRDTFGHEHSLSGELCALVAPRPRAPPKEIRAGCHCYQSRLSRGPAPLPGAAEEVESCLKLTVARSCGNRMAGFRKARRESLPSASGRWLR